MRASKAFFLLLVLIVLAVPVSAQEPQQVVEQLLRQQQPKRHLMDGIAVGADLLGAGLKLAGNDWSQMEAFVRLNLYDKYFPVLELGYGEADHEGRELDNHFAVKAPYFRIGADYCFTKQHNGNRLFGGLRYGYSNYEYDLDSPVPLTDPVWQTAQDFRHHGLSGNTHWVEAVFGVETRIWRIVSMGWDLRFKLRASQKSSEIGKPWYVPGMSMNDSSLNWGGTFKLVFDLTRR